MYKKIFSVFLCFLLVFVLCSCGNTPNEPITIDFYHFDDDALSEIENKNVVIYGYFLLNPVKNNIAYICESPLQGITNDQSQYEEGTTYAKISVSTNGVIAVSFKETPEYTSKPVCIKGKLIKGKFTDDYYFEYNFMIIDATVEEVEPYRLPPTAQMYCSLVDRDIINALYISFLQIQYFASSPEDFDEFPSQALKEIISDLEEQDSRNELEEDILKVTKNLDEIYDKYNSLYPDKIDYSKLYSETTTLYSSFLTSLKTFAGISAYERENDEA